MVQEANPFHRARRRWQAVARVLQATLTSDDETDDLASIQHENFVAMLFAPAPDLDAVRVKLEALREWHGAGAQETAWLQTVIDDLSRLNHSPDAANVLDFPAR